MNKVLFLVHGMGVHGKDWASGVMRQLTDIPDRNGYGWFARNGGLSANLGLVPITFDQSFTRYLKLWSESSVKLQDYAVANGIAIHDVLKWLNGASKEEGNFFWSHLVDVVMYRFLSIVTAEVRLRAARELAKEITARTGNGELVEASVLAHSLGTSVAHDTLALLGSRPIDGNKAFMVGSFQFTNVFMLANVGRVLETDPLPYKSVLHPDTTSPQDAYCQYYYNFRHTLDPFPAVKAFRPVNWGAAYVAVESLDKVHAFDVHGLDHYLAAPHVHIPILRGLFGPVITEAEERAAVAAYDAIPELPCAAALKQFKVTVARLIALIETSGDRQTLVKAGSQFLATAKEAADVCGE